MSRMLAYDPQARITAREALAHPYLAGACCPPQTLESAMHATFAQRCAAAAAAAAGEGGRQASGTPDPAAGWGAGIGGGGGRGGGWGGSGDGGEGMPN
jgi:hypothetical protein